MSRILFISDLHLCQEKPMITAGFLSFLARESLNCDALYILGDLFEAWIGDDDSDLLHKQVASALHDLPFPVFFIYGNRDFLISKDYRRASGITLLPEEYVLDCYGHRVLILHGDTLCTDDTGYQRFRATVHQYWIQKLFLALPLFIRKLILSRMRDGSNQANQHKSLTIMDVNAKTVETMMLRQHVRIMIHGHTHRPAIHYFELNGTLAERAVLGAWHHTCGSMIQLDNNGISLIDFEF
ncbi:UDP-2,3-diacylglucosamine diphosphatase [Pantoea sp. Nvir]|uniref:UDP-2,3-diacylglucosamine diphosphatase n=1 Tax=Pantoea sp. Nvir TaxID=2576760 RepID=UPI0027ED5134|nr:UDP-2,3-diacylglucosamine diphosphatase [Pantoea sp. Nvir]CAJ0993057.1 UDP-2,3-diacylglucosamine hydrolase [Pantoea sp. Nvir]